MVWTSDQPEPDPAEEDAPVPEPDEDAPMPCIDPDDPANT